MTDAAFYQRMDALATKLLTKFGSPATIRRQPETASQKPNAEGKVVKQPPENFPGLAVKINSETSRDLFAEVYEFIHVVKTPTRPQTDDLLIHATETYKIKAVRTVNPAGQGLIVSIVGSTKP